jgi:hypothetical protein
MACFLQSISLGLFFRIGDIIVGDGVVRSP